MEKVMKLTNFLLAVIAVCLVLIVAKIYDVNVPAKAYAQTQVKPQPVYLVYWPDQKNARYHAVVGNTGIVPTSR